MIAGGWRPDQHCADHQIHPRHCPGIRASYCRDIRHFPDCVPLDDEHDDLVCTHAPGIFSLTCDESCGRPTRELPAYSLDGSNTIIRSIMLRFAGCVTGGVGILAIADLFIQRWRFEQSIKQTKAEVKEDIKALGCNPAIKNKI